MKIMKRCSKPGCRELVSSTETYCRKHKRTINKEYDKIRLNYNVNDAQMYHTARWRKLRQIALSRDNNLCVECLSKGVISEAKIVDHIKRADDNPELKWNLDNLQSLCRPCHNKKTAKEITTPR